MFMIVPKWSKGGATSTATSQITSKGSAKEEPSEARNRAIRVHTACDSCRIHKVKCDGLEPCDRCKIGGSVCVYTRLKGRGGVENTAQHQIALLEAQQRRLISAIKSMQAVIESHTGISSTSDPHDFDLHAVLQKYGQSESAGERALESWIPDQPTLAPSQPGGSDRVATATTVHPPPRDDPSSDDAQTKRRRIMSRSASKATYEGQENACDVSINETTHPETDVRGDSELENHGSPLSIMAASRQFQNTSLDDGNRYARELELLQQMRSHAARLTQGRKSSQNTLQNLEPAIQDENGLEIGSELSIPLPTTTSAGPQFTEDSNKPFMLQPTAPSAFPNPGNMFWNATSNEGAPNEDDSILSQSYSYPFFDLIDWEASLQNFEGHYDDFVDES